MVERLHRSLFRVYRRMPTGMRRRVVRTLAPTFTVGSICVIERADGAVLLVRHFYRQRWGTPGGLLKRGEDPADAVRREVREEIGLDVTLVGEPAVVVTPDPRRVDIVFRGVPTRGSSEQATPCSPEIIAVEWFPAGALPELQAETTAALVALARASRPRPVSGWQAEVAG